MVRPKRPEKSYSETQSHTGLYVCEMRTEKQKKIVTKAPTGAFYGDGSGLCRRNSHVSRPYRYHHQVSSNMQSKQSKHFSFRQTARGFFSTSDNPAPIRMSNLLGAGALHLLILLCQGEVDGILVSSEQVEASNDASDVAMSAIKTSLSALQVGSAFATKIPFIAPVAGLLLQALAMRDASRLYFPSNNDVF